VLKGVWLILIFVIKGKALAILQFVYIDLCVHVQFYKYPQAVQFDLHRNASFDLGAFNNKGAT
jgi:hypothetical protein